MFAYWTAHAISLHFSGLNKQIVKLKMNVLMKRYHKHLQFNFELHVPCIVAYVTQQQVRTARNAYALKRRRGRLRQPLRSTMLPTCCSSHLKSRIILHSANFLGIDKIVCALKCLLKDGLSPEEINRSFCLPQSYVLFINYIKLTE